MHIYASVWDLLIYGLLTVIYFNNMFLLLLCLPWVTAGTSQIIQDFRSSLKLLPASARPPCCVPGALASLGDHQHPVTSKKCHKQPEAEAGGRFIAFFLIRSRGEPGWGGEASHTGDPVGRPILGDASAPHFVAKCADREARQCHRDLTCPSIPRKGPGVKQKAVIFLASRRIRPS